MIDKMMSISKKMQENRFISSLTNGLISATPLLMVGAIFAVINSFPIAGYQNFLITTKLKVITSLPTNITTNLISVYLAFIIAYLFAKKSDRKESMEIGILALMSFLIITPIEISDSYAITAIKSDWLGAAGMFTAFIVSLSSAAICTWLYQKEITIKMPEGVPEAVSKSFSALIPGFVVAFLFLLVRYLFMLTPFESMHKFIYGVIGAPLTVIGSSFWAFLIFVLLIHVFWFLGIHGSLLVIGIVAPIITPLGIENLAAYNAGQTIPHILTTTFLFQSIGATAGNTLGLVIAMCFAKSKRYQTVGKLGLVPNIFSVNEPIIFATPIVMNFSLLIPFVAVPVVSFVGAYVLTLIDILPRMNGVSVPAGIPIVLGGIMSGGWKWGVYQLLTVLFSYGMYLPFFKKMDNQEYKLEQGGE